MLATHDVDERNRIIGENLRRYRLLKGLTQDELAEGVCSISQLSKIENGKTYIKRSLLKLMAERLSVTVERIESMDPLKEELTETLQLAKDALTLHNYTKSMEFVVDVIEKGREFSYEEHLIEGILLKCRLLMVQYRYEEVIHIATAALEEELYRESSQKVRLLTELGHAYVYSGNMMAAYDYFTRADEEFEQQKSDLDTQLKLYFELARCNSLMQNYRTALRYSEKAEKLALEYSIHKSRIRASYVKADFIERLGDAEKAEAIYLLALKEAEDNQYLLDVAVINNNIGCLYQNKGSVGQAIAHFQRARKLFELLGEPRYSLQALTHLAELSIQEEDYEEAERLIQEVFAVASQVEVNTYREMAQAKRVHGQVRAAQGDFESYVVNLQEALQIYDDNYVIIEAYEVATELAEALYQRGDSRALEMYRKAIEYNKRNKKFGVRR